MLRVRSFTIHDNTSRTNKRTNERFRVLKKLESRYEKEKKKKIITTTIMIQRIFNIDEGETRNARKGGGRKRSNKNRCFVTGHIICFGARLRTF